MKPIPGTLRRAIPALGVAALFTAAALAGGDVADVTPASAAPAEPAPDAVVLTVNGQEVRQAEIDRALEAAAGVPLASLGAEQRAKLREQLGAQAEERVIDEHLLTAAAEREKIAATQEEIDAEMAALTKRLPEGKSLAEALKGVGLTEEALRAEIARGLAIEKLLRGKADGAPAPTEEEVARFHADHPDSFVRHESVEASHILFAVPEGADAAAKEKVRAQAEEVRARLVKDPARFAELAAEYSACPSGKDGGNLGRFERGQMVPAFEDAAFKQKVGEIGSLVETPYGFHIILVRTHEPEAPISLDEARASIVRHLSDASRREAVERFVKHLRSDATVLHLQAGS